MKKTETVWHIFAIVAGRKKYISVHYVRAVDSRFVQAVGTAYHWQYDLRQF